MWKSLSHSAQTLAALHYRFWCHTSPVLCMKQKIILKLGFNHFKIKFLLGNIINPCQTGWLFRMSSSYTFLFAETDRHVRFVRFPKFQPLTPTSSYNTLPTKIQNFTLIMGWQLLVCLVISVCCLISFSSYFLTNTKTHSLRIQKFFPQSALPFYPSFSHTTLTQHFSHCALETH